MPEEQISFPLEPGDGSAPPTTPELRSEIAQAWGLPLGERAEIRFRGRQIDAATGVLELLNSPDFPWNPREPLQLRIAGFPFSSRDIESWTRL